MKSINEVVSNYYNFPQERLIERTNKDEVVTKRQLCIYFHCMYSKMSYRDIAWLLGYKKHSSHSAIYTIRSINKKRKEISFDSEVKDINKILLKEGYQLVDRKKYTFKREYL